MEILDYLHAAVLVSDLAAAEAFYGGVLGLQKVERSLNFPGIWYQIGAVQLHLMQHPSYAAQVPTPTKLGRNPHLAFTVADLEQAKAQLLAQGCVVQASSSGRAALFTQDPDGNVIELQQG